MADDIYRKIQRQLDNYSIGFPDTESGVEIEILKFLFDASEALLFSKLSDKLETADAVATKAGLPADATARNLEQMARKGLVYRTRTPTGVNYSAVPFIHGLLEFQGPWMSKELVNLTGKYIKEKLKSNMAGQSGMRVIPIRETVDIDHQVASYDDVYELLKKEDLIVVADCSCRLQHKQLDKACDSPLEACLMVGHMAEYYIDNEMARKIDLEEAMKIIETCQSAGLITQAPSVARPFMICNCCTCCCGFLGAIRRTARPVDMVFTNHVCRIETDKCSGCEDCIEKCQMLALRMNKEQVAEIDYDRCVGCGLCITVCPDKAMALIPRPDEEQSVPGEIKTAFAFYDFDT